MLTPKFLGAIAVLQLLHVWTVLAASEHSGYLFRTLTSEVIPDLSTVLLRLHRTENPNVEFSVSESSHSDDVPFHSVDLKFSFPFVGPQNAQILDKNVLGALTFISPSDRHRSVRISPNGAIHFNYYPPCGSTTTVEGTCTIHQNYDNMITPLVQDYYPPNALVERKGIKYLSTQSMFSVLWNEVPTFETKDENQEYFTFSVTLHSNGRVTFRYGQLGNNIETLKLHSKSKVLAGIVPPSNIADTIGPSLTSFEKKTRSTWTQRQQAAQSGFYPPDHTVKTGNTLEFCLLPDRSEYSMKQLDTCADLYVNQSENAQSGVYVSLDEYRPLLGCMEAGFPLLCKFTDSTGVVESYSIKAIQAVNPLTGILGVFCSLNDSPVTKTFVENIPANSSSDNTTSFDHVLLQYTHPDEIQMLSDIPATNPSEFRSSRDLGLVYGCGNKVGFKTPAGLCNSNQFRDCGSTCVSDPSSPFLVYALDASKSNGCCLLSEVDCFGKCNGGALAIPFNGKLECCKNAVCDDKGQCECNPRNNLDYLQDINLWQSIATTGGIISILCVLVAFVMVYRTSLHERMLQEAMEMAEQRRALPKEGRDNYVTVVTFREGMDLKSCGPNPDNDVSVETITATKNETTQESLSGQVVELEMQQQTQLEPIQDSQQSSNSEQSLPSPPNKSNETRPSSAIEVQTLGDDPQDPAQSVLDSKRSFAGSITGKFRSASRTSNVEDKKMAFLRQSSFGSARSLRVRAASRASNADDKKMARVHQSSFGTAKSFRVRGTSRASNADDTTLALPRHGSFGSGRDLGVRTASSVSIAHLEEAEAQESMCSVCICDYEEGDQVAILQCSHNFHYDCIMPWFDKSSVCPLCRRDVRGPDFVDPSTVPHFPHPSFDFSLFRNRPLPIPRRIVQVADRRRAPVLSESDITRVAGSTEASDGTLQPIGSMTLGLFPRTSSFTVLRQMRAGLARAVSAPSSVWSRQSWQQSTALDTNSTELQVEIHPEVGTESEPGKVEFDLMNNSARNDRSSWSRRSTRGRSPVLSHGSQHSMISPLGTPEPMPLAGVLSRSPSFPTLMRRSRSIENIEPPVMQGNPMFRSESSERLSAIDDNDRMPTNDEV